MARVLQGLRFARPRIALMARAALSAGLAWLVVSLIPEVGDEYPYYAPFGAVLATTFTLSISVKESVQAVSAIALGGATAWGVDILFGTTSALTIALVVAAGVALAAIPWLGPMAGWVPTAAIFTLIIGHGEATFAGSYAGLTLLGAGIGVGVNVIFPPLPMAPARRALLTTKRQLADQLADLAGHLEDDDFPSITQWEERYRGLGRSRAAMQEAISRAQEARFANRRARRHAADIDAIVDQAQGVDRLVLVVSDLSDLILRDQTAPGHRNEVTQLPGPVRIPIAEALRLLGKALTGADDEDIRADLETVDDRLAAIGEDMTEEIRGPQTLIVDSTLLTLRRGLETFAQHPRGTPRTEVEDGQQSA